MKKLTKEMIEKMALEIRDECIKRECSNVCIYFNDKRIHLHNEWDGENLVAKSETEENMNPHDYFEYAAYDHILSMSFEGNEIYESFNYTNYEAPKWLQKIFDKYGVYSELGHSWNLSVFPNDDGMEVEYTIYERPKERKHFSRHIGIPEIDAIHDMWEALMQIHKPCGSIIIGDGINFEYNDQPYFMSTNWNQSDSPTEVINAVKRELEFIGATNIWYDCGRLD